MPLKTSGTMVFYPFVVLSTMNVMVLVVGFSSDFDICEQMLYDSIFKMLLKEK